MQGSEWDSTMDYYGCTRVWRSFVGDNDWVMDHIPEYAASNHKYTALQAKSQMMGFLSRLPFAIQQNLFNLMDSHDLDRLHNNPVCYEDYRGAVIGQFTMIGAPSIYYGDEAGIEGRTDDMEGCRYPMPWNSGFEGSKQYRLHRDLAHIRNEHRVFGEGSFQFIYCQGQVLSFARYDEDECWISVINSSDEDTAVKLPVGILGVELRKEIAEGIASSDELGTEIAYNISENGSSLDMKLSAHTSYLIRIK